MKPKFSRVVLVLLVGMHVALALGCANTGRGIQKDYQKAEDKVERIGK